MYGPGKSWCILQPGTAEGTMAIRLYGSARTTPRSCWRQCPDGRYGAVTDRSRCGYEQRQSLYSSSRSTRLERVQWVDSCLGTLATLGCGHCQPAT